MKEQNNGRGMNMRDKIDWTIKQEAYNQLRDIENDERNQHTRCYSCGKKFG